jgi:Na+/proline symporter
MAVAVLVALVGLALHAYYRQHPLAGEALALYREKPDRIFPIFVLQELPAGLKGLVVAGAFAAAISSLDSILAALSQTTMSAFVLPRLSRGGELDAALERRALRLSRALVVVFGVLLCALALGCERIARDPRFSAVLDLALSMPGYTLGALLAGFALAFAFRGRVDGSGYLFSAPLSVLAVLSVAWHARWTELALAAGSAALLAAWTWTRVLRGNEAALARAGRTLALLAGLGLVAWIQAGGFTTAWPWFAPVGAAFAFAFGVLLARRPAVSGRRERPPATG